MTKIEALDIIHSTNSRNFLRLHHFIRDNRKVFKDVALDLALSGELEKAHVKDETIISMGDSFIFIREDDLEILLIIDSTSIIFRFTKDHDKNRLGYVRIAKDITIWNDDPETWNYKI